MKRLIPKEMIPNTLWNSKDSILYLPPQLLESWKMLLSNHGLLEKAKEIVQEPFEGGESKEDTDNHLIWRFAGSSARVALTMLDPYDDLAEISNVFTRIFAGNRAFIADLPCGSGAASLTILSILFELRKQNKIPRMPLHVVIVGGEISKYAQEYAHEALASLAAELETEAITIEFEMVDWDVCDQFSNTDLIKFLTVKSHGCSAKLLIAANFSGFLHRNGKWKIAEKQFEELFRHSRDDNSVVLWVEPNMGSVTSDNGFMATLDKWFKKRFPMFVDETKQSYGESTSEVSHPINDGKFITRSVVREFNLPLQRKP